MAEKVDLRVVKTRRSIEAAFVKLLKSKSFEHITVQNILDEALVNRKTFYKHYEDKYNLADVMIERLDEHLEKALHTRFERVKQPSDMPDALREFYLTLFEEREAALSLMKVRTAHHYITEDYLHILKDAYLERFAPLRPDADQGELDYLANSYAALVYSSIRWALESGDPSCIDIICDVSYRHVNAPGTTFMSFPTEQH